MNTRLKVAIVESGKRGYQVAQEMGIHDTRLTKIIQGSVKPRESEKNDLAKILGKPISEFFPCDDAR